MNIVNDFNPLAETGFPDRPRSCWHLIHSMCNRWPFLVLNTVLFLVWIHFHKWARDTLILLTSVFTHPILCIEVRVCQVSCCSSSLFPSVQKNEYANGYPCFVHLWDLKKNGGNKFTGLWFFWWLDCKLAKIKMKLIHSPSYILPLYFHTNHTAAIKRVEMFRVISYN